MATRIVFAGGESLLVAEDPDTVDGQPVHVRPGSILYVTSV